MNRPIFIISASRSGSTAMAKMLGTANNGKSFSEPEPKLCVEQRLFYKFGIENIDIDAIVKMKNMQIKNIEENLIYIDKNPNYILFFPYFEKYLNAKFLILFRDGRDVVRSFMDWTDVMGKKLYMTHEDSNDYSYISPCENHWDFSFFRPNKSNSLYKEWKNLTKFEKFSWYWAEANSLILQNLTTIDEKSYKIVNMDSIDAKKMEEIFNFCELDNFDEFKIDNMLNSKINSIEERINIKRKFPSPNNWTKEQNNLFMKYAGKIKFKLEKEVL